MTYNNYKFTFTKNGEGMIGWATGRTIEEAAEHFNFWAPAGNRIGDGITPEKWTKTGTFTGYPYTMEDALAEAFRTKPESIRLINESKASTQDKEDLARIIEEEDAAAFAFLDTACQEWLLDIMEK